MNDNEQYTLTKPLGRGGMGQVWAAHKHGEQGMQMPCAIKVLWPALALTKEDRERFYGEARIAVQLDHGRIVKVIDAGVIHGSPSLVMEWVDGVDLRELLEQARAAGTLRLDLSMSLYIVGEILTALEYAHCRTVAGRDAGVVHSDITPGNILISSSAEVKLTDFGIARLVTAAGRTLSRAVGTPRYMAPEQMEGRIRRATDIYGLGVVLHELLEGERYLGQCSAEQFQARVLRGDIPSLTQRDIPNWVDELRRRMLAHDPAERPKAGDAHSMIVQRTPGYAFAARELKHLYQRCIGKARSRFTDLLELNAGGDESLGFASVVGEVEAEAEPAPVAAPLAAHPDAPALLRRAPRLPASLVGHDHDASWGPPVEATIRLAPVDEQPPADEPTQRLFTAAHAPDRLPDRLPGPLPIDAPLAWVARGEGSPAVFEGYGLGDGIGAAAAVSPGRSSWMRTVAFVSAAVALLCAGVLLATALDAAFAPAEPLAPRETPSQLALQVSPAPPPEPEPEPEPESQVLAPEPESQVLAPEPEPESRAPKPKPKPAIDVTFSIPGVAVAQIEAGKRSIAYDKFARVKLRAGSYPIRWRRDPNDPWRGAGTLQIEDKLPAGTFYTVKLSSSDMSVRKQEKGSAK